MSNRLILIICAFVLFAGVAVWVAIFAFDARRQAAPNTTLISQPPGTATTSAAEARFKPSPAPSVISIEAARGMVSFDYKWHKDGFGTIMIVDFTFTNRSPYPAKDITVTCTHYAPSGTEIDSNTRTIYELIPAKGKKTVKDFNMGFIHSQASSTSCKIDNFDM